MSRRIRIPTDELYRRAVAYVDRRGDTLIRRGGRGGGGAWATKKKFDPTKIYVLGNLGTAHQYKTAVGGGEGGDAAGFGYLALARVEQIGSAQNLTRRATISPGTGFDLQHGGSARITCYIANGAGTRVSSGNNATFTASNIGQILLVGGQLAGGFVRSFIAPGQPHSQAACVGLTPDTVNQLVFGALADNPSLSPFALIAFRGEPTEAQISELALLVRTLGDFPKTWAFATIVHRWSLREELAKGGTAVIDGQLAPASLPDTVTAATIDRMDRQGSPVVRVIDSAVDGRKTYGAMGFSAANYLTTANPGGTAGALTGTWDAWYGCIDSAAGANRFPFGRGNAVNGGHLFQIASSSMYYRVGNGSALVDKSMAIPASDIGVPLLFVGVIGGGNVRLFYKRAEVGSPAAISAYADYIGPTRLGNGGNGSESGDPYRTFGAAQGKALPTDAEILQLFDDVARTGRIQPIPGKTDHLWDLTADIIANGGPQNGIPAQVLDRVGTDHLTMMGGLRVVNEGITNFAGSVIRTAGTVFPGSVGGFWAEVLADMGTLTGTQVLFASSLSGSAGWRITATAAEVAALFYTDTAASVSVRKWPVTQGRHHFAFVYDGTVVRFYYDGQETEVSAAFVYAPSSTFTTLGSIGSGSLATTTHVVRGGSVGATVPTAAEIATASAAALSTGKVVGVPGKTGLQWSVVDDVLEAGGKVPAIVKERVSVAANMIVVNSALQVAQRCERLWSWEAA